MNTTAIDIDRIRAQFPALQTGFAYLENAGGSQVPSLVADAVRDYMLTSYVQLGAGYPASEAATKVVADAHDWINLFMNGVGHGQVVLGPSTTQLVTMLAECYGRALEPGDEIIICETGHEANVGPWVRLADRGMNIKTWKVSPETLQCSLDDLYDLLSPRTKIVAFPHVSNLLGEIVDVKAISELAHRVGARVVVDGVAYAPHRAIDVADWNADWYVYSTYKVYGPHMGALYGKFDAFERLQGPNHFFISDSDPYKFELGGVNHEGCAGLLALKEYLTFVAQSNGFAGRQTVTSAFNVMEECELATQGRLIDYLRSKPLVRVVGPQNGGSGRVSTISFVHERMSSPEISAAVDRHPIGIRWGHMYAHRLCEAAGISTETGVVRVSMVHYNTVEEIDRLIGVFEQIGL